MDFHTENMLDSLQTGDITRFKQDFGHKMNELILSKIEDKKSSVMQSVQEEEGDEGPKVDGGEDDTIFADPAMSK